MTPIIYDMHKSRRVDDWDTTSNTDDGVLCLYSDKGARWKLVDQRMLWLQRRDEETISSEMISFVSQVCYATPSETPVSANPITG